VSGIGVGVGASIDDFCHSDAKPAADFSQHGRAAAVFHYIVQQSGNDEIFIAAGFQYKRSHTHQVRDVRNGRGLSRLPRVLLSCKKKSAQEAWTESHRRTGGRGFPSWFFVSFAA